jgi:uncharacterized protein (DUF305 family)
MEFDYTITTTRTFDEAVQKVQDEIAKAGTSRLEMLTLANNITESQSKEIEQMQSWHKSWYK